MAQGEAKYGEHCLVPEFSGFQKCHCSMLAVTSSCHPKNPKSKVHSRHTAKPKWIWELVVRLRESEKEPDGQVLGSRVSPFNWMRFLVLAI